MFVAFSANVTSVSSEDMQIAALDLFELGNDGAVMPVRLSVWPHWKSATRFSKFVAQADADAMGSSQ